MSIVKMSGTSGACQEDAIAVEEPLEIRLAYGGADHRSEKIVSITMRTPGADLELAAGFLFTEGIVACRDDLAALQVRESSVVATLVPGCEPDIARLERHFYTSSSCGVCGKTSLDAVVVAPRFAIPPNTLILDAAVVHALPSALRRVQSMFDHTGGQHAAALFDAEGQLLTVREDVGRHNAVDKVIGSQLLAGHLPRSAHGLFVSGRASFELVQKAMMAGISVLAAVGAPSSASVDLAQSVGMTVLGFVRDGRFNIYCGAHRIREAVT